MARNFKLSINLDGSTMQTGADVADALMVTASKLAGQVDFGPTERGVIRDADGAVVGMFEVEAVA